MDKVILFFSKPMDKTSVEKSFALTWIDGSSGVNNKVEGSFGWDNENKSMTFTPLRSLREGTMFTVADVSRRNGHIRKSI